MLGRSDKSNEMHIKARKITTKVSVAMTLIIIATSIAWVVNGYDQSFNPDKESEIIDELTHYYLPNILMFIFCTLLLVSLIWICRSLKHDKHMMGNEKFMAIHLGFLLITVAS